MSKKDYSQPHEKTSSLADRVLTLEVEKQNKPQFFFQYLLAPILVVLLDALFNLQL
ncbi:hypothetical protein [Shewanella waksmanii]|uniref:hypothetical protein n=1 Tax=Shewanella waksmanii TaxID=213783 RepID=UPI00373501EC